MSLLNIQCTRSYTEKSKIYVTAYRKRDLRVIEVTFFENSLKINLSSKNYNNGSKVASIYELQFGPIIIIIMNFQRI